MAFSAAGLNCLAVGPTKLYIYNTTDTITAASAKTNFCTNNCPGLSAGDIIIIAHNTSAALAVVRVTHIAAAESTVVAIAALG